MTETALRCHPLSENGFVEGISAQVNRAEGDRLRVKFTLQGLVNQIHFSQIAQPERTDELWKDTCFEMFWGVPDQGGYFEFNFAPSGQWAAYAFTGYRQGMKELSCVPPRIDCSKGEKIFEMTVNLDVPEPMRDMAAIVGFSAVIADNDGRTSYWALAHAPGKPDFHHKDCFALQLDARSAA